MTSVGGLPLDAGFYLSTYDIGSGNVPANTPSIGGWAVDGTYAYIKVVSGTIGSGAYSNGGRAFNSQGAAFATFDAPGSTSRSIGGIAHTNEGAMHITTGSPAFSIGGIPVTATGAVCVGTSMATTSSDYDGTNDYMTRGADLTNIADGKQGIASVWVRAEGGDGGAIDAIMVSAPAAAKLAIYRTATTNTITVLARNAAGGTIMNMVSTNAITTASGWVHILASWNLASGLGHLYINDADVKAGGATLTDDTIDYTNGNFVIGAVVDGTLKWNGCLAEMFFHTTYLDITTVANRRKFYTAAGRPAYLGADGSLPLGVQPLYYDRAADGTNAGSGGNLTVTGALTACATSP